MDLDKDFTGAEKKDKSQLPHAIEQVCIVLFCLILVAIAAIIIGGLAYIAVNVWQAAV